MGTERLAMKGLNMLGSATFFAPTSMHGKHAGPKTRKLPRLRRTHVRSRLQPTFTLHACGLVHLEHPHPPTLLAIRRVNVQGPLALLRRSNNPKRRLDVLTWPGTWEPHLRTTHKRPQPARGESSKYAGNGNAEQRIIGETKRRGKGTSIVRVYIVTRVSC